MKEGEEEEENKTKKKLNQDVPSFKFHIWRLHTFLHFKRH